jgi:hypothetical protein
VIIKESEVCLVKILNSDSLADARGTKGKAKWTHVFVHCYNNVLSNVSLRLGSEFLLLLIKLFFFMMSGVDGLLISA